MKRIPIKCAKDVAKQYDLDQVIVVGFDSKTGLTHVVTYGKSMQNCLQAAQGGNQIKRLFGFPEEMCNDIPKRKENSIE